LDADVDLRQLKAQHVEIEGHRDIRELFQMGGQERVVPCGKRGQLVVGNHESLGLGLRQVIQQEHRHARQPEQLSSFEAGVSGDHLHPAVDQDGNIEPGRLDALG
jgi:hypothetical protein